MNGMKEAKRRFRKAGVPIDNPFPGVPRLKHKDTSIYRVHQSTRERARRYRQDNPYEEGGSNE